MATLEQERRKIEQLQQHTADELERVAGREREHLEGWIPSLATTEETREALEKAFDYRGDVTLTLKDGRVIDGYIFDRRTGTTLQDSFVRVIPSNERAKLSIAYAEIAALAFTGNDKAAGKRFEDWVKQYTEKKAAGEKDVSIHPESLED